MCSPEGIKETALKQRVAMGNRWNVARQESLFYEWLQENYPDIVLNPAQIEFVRVFFDTTRKSGRTFILNLLHSFDERDKRG